MHHSTLTQTWRSVRPFLTKASTPRFSSLSTSLFDGSNSCASQHETLIEEYYQRQPTNTSLHMLTRSGRGDLLDQPYRTEAFLGRMGQRLANQRILAQYATFLKRELPIRLARDIRDLETIRSFRDFSCVQDVKNVYLQSFLELVESRPIHCPSDEEEFAQLMERLYTKHANVLIQIAKGAYLLRKQVQEDLNRRHPTMSLDAIEYMDQCHHFLDRFYASRIGIRVLAGQYLTLRQSPRPDYVGMICTKTSPSEIVQRAGRTVMGICRAKYGRTPLVEIDGRLDLTFPYLPTYLEYVVLELLKNALRATVETHATNVDLPPVRVIIADGDDNEDVVIKIADEGGGIPRSQMHKIWSYLYTTADSTLQEAIFSGRDTSKISPLAGLGYGLPISRSYCRYFGGDINLMSMDGHGTDVFIYLKRLDETEQPTALERHDGIE